VLSLTPGEIAVAAPIQGRGAIAGLVSVVKRDLFGDALQRAARDGSGVQLLEATAAGAPVFTLTSIGVAVPGDLGTAGGQAWQRDRDDHRWLVTEARIGDGPLLLRLAQPALLIEEEVSRSYRNLVAIVAAALLLMAIGGAVLAVSIRRLETAEVELEHARSLAAMGKASAAIAHEVKNSLNGLSVSLDLLAQGRAPPETAAQVHSQARSEIARLRGVADDLTLFAAQPRLDRADLSLVDLCQQAVAGVTDVAQDVGVQVAVSAPTGERLLVHGDDRKLLGALQNVIRNGIEAMGPGAFGDALDAVPPERDRQLSLALRREGGTAILEVSDRGPGLAVEVRARLFEPFLTTKRGGTGLGLAIARRVVEAHGGSIAAFDRAGGGTTFRIKLPLSTYRARREAPAAETTE
jgi:signal transduction histidine kinase